MKKKGLLVSLFILVLISLIWLFEGPESGQRAFLPNTPVFTETPSPILPTSTLTQEPTATPIPPSPTPTEIPPPLTDAAIKECPVTLPNARGSEFGNYYMLNHGNETDSIFTILQDDGKWVFEPNGPGEIREDGSLRIKWPWYRTVEGDVIISGTRLDAHAPPMPEEILHGEEDGYEETGFHPSLLTFPSEGCWEVTASVGEERLTFILLVINNS